MSDPKTPDLDPISRLGRLDDRLLDAERGIVELRREARELRDLLGAPAASRDAQRTAEPEEEATVPAPEPASASALESREVPMDTRATAPASAPEPPVGQTSEPETEAFPELDLEPLPEPPPPEPCLAEPAATSPVQPAMLPPAPKPPKPSGPDGDEPGESLETRIGADWLLRIGLVALTIGFALLSRYIHPQLDPWHKVALCYLASVVLTGAGLALQERLRRFARPLAAGGVALAFFTGFAGHFLEPMACFSLPVSLLLMSLAVAAMFALAERWRSQTVAGTAVLLGHVSALVASGQQDLFSLVAIAVLSALAVGLSLRHGWTPLGFLAAAGAYVSHGIWVLQEHAVTTPETAFWLNMGFFTSYLLVFLAGDLLRLRGAELPATPVARGPQILAARATGPVSLTLYVTASVTLFGATEIYWDRLHLFLFPVAALAAAGLFLHLRRRNGETLFYGTLAVLLATLGLFSWLEGLSLNLVLASEALLLLLLSRQPGLRFLGALAQLVLAVGFVHFWLSEAHRPSTWPAFLGSLLTGGIYMVKARVEETWEPGRTLGRAWGARREALVRTLVRRLGYLHALLGVGLVAYTSTRFLEPPLDAVPPALLAVAVGAAALARRSGVWTVAAWSFQLATAVLVLRHAMLPVPAFESLSFSPREIWIVDGLLVSLMAAGAWAASALGRGRGREEQGAAGILGLLLTVPAALAAAWVGGEQPALVPLWLLAPLALWVEGEAWRGYRPSPASSADSETSPLGRIVTHRLPLLRALLGVGGAFLLLWVVWASLSWASPALWLTVGLGAAAAAAAILFRSPQLVLALCAYLGLAWPVLNATLAGGDWTGQPLDRSLAPWAFITLAAGAGLALSLRARGEEGAAFRRGALAALAVALASLGSVLAFVGAGVVPAWLWLLPAACFWTALERICSRSRAAGPRGLATASVVAAALLSALGAAFSLELAQGYLPRHPELLSALTMGLALAAMTVSLWRRSVVLGAAYGVALAESFLIFAFDVGLPTGLDDHPLVAGLLAAGGLAAGLVLESALRRRAPESPPNPTLAMLASWHAVVPGGLLGIALIHAHAERLAGDSLWAFPVVLGLALLLGQTASRHRLEWTLIASLGFAAWPAAWLLLVGFLGTGGAVYLPVVLASIGLIVGLERVLSGWPSGEETSAATGLRPLVRGALVITAAGLALLLCAVAPQVEGSWTTIGWSLSAFALLALGFALRSRLYRLTGLVVFGLTLLRVVVVDLAGLELFYRMMAFLGLGVCLILVSLLYSAHRSRLRRWL
jgi:hypothetical protein